MSIFAWDDRGNYWADAANFLGSGVEIHLEYSGERKNS